MNTSTQTHYRICPLCEATCGLEIKTEGRNVTSIRGDAEDVFSAGYICPKGVALKELDADPDRLRGPMVRRNGELVPATWDEAFAEIDKRLIAILDEHGPESVAAYSGNPSAHNTSLLLYNQAMLRVLPGKNRFSASSVDQVPKHVSSGLMFGTFLSIPVPDIDRTQYFLMLGANPMASNGSLFTAPDFRGRVRKMQERGGKLVVVDPRRSETADVADEHLFIRPGTDAHFLAAIANTLFAEGLVNLGRLAPHTNGLLELEKAVAEFSPERMAPFCGISAETIRRVAGELVDNQPAAVYGRIGTCTQEFGTTVSWLIDVINVLTGNLDRPGGAMFPLAPAFSSNAQGRGGQGSGVKLGRGRSRVRGVPEVMSEFPVACMAEEIDTPGEGQIRALITVAGNPAVSTPNTARLSRALAALDFMVCVDIYLNETTRHADVILPGLSPLENSHYDIVFPQLSVRNWARYSPPVFEKPDRPAEWEIMLRLSGILMRQGPSADIAALDDFIIRMQAQSMVNHKDSTIVDRDVEEILKALEPRRGPERIVDFALRSGPYGDAFGERPGLTLRSLEEAPHGIDLGALQSRVPEVLCTLSGKIELAPELIVGDLVRLEESLATRKEDQMVLVGRRQVRSNNSWLHNLPLLAKGPFRCTMQIHPDDAQRLGVADGAKAAVSSRAGRITVIAECTDRVMPGVVSIPHGWGHDEDGASLQVAADRPGANSNRLTDEFAIDPLSGNAVLCGIPVSVEPASV